MRSYPRPSVSTCRFCCRGGNYALREQFTRTSTDGAQDAKLSLPVPVNAGLNPLLSVSICVYLCLTPPEAGKHREHRAAAVRRTPDYGAPRRREHREKPDEVRSLTGIEGCGAGFHPSALIPATGGRASSPPQAGKPTEAGKLLPSISVSSLFVFGREVKEYWPNGQWTVGGWQ